MVLKDKDGKTVAIDDGADKEESNRKFARYIIWGLWLSYLVIAMGIWKASIEQSFLGSLIDWILVPFHDVVDDLLHKLGVTISYGKFRGGFSFILLAIIANRAAIFTYAFLLANKPGSRWLGKG
jgi:hypothetical protein